MATRIFSRLSDLVLKNPLALKAWGDKLCDQVEAALDAQTQATADLAAVVADLEQAVLDIQAAQATADTAVTNAATAQSTANTAQTTATTAQSTAATANATATDAKKNDKLTASYTDPIYILSASDAGSDATISIMAHDRKYGDGTSVSISADTITGKSYSTEYFIYYNDSTYSDTTPNFIATTNSRTAQTNPATGRHFLGSITTPAAGGGSTTGSSGGPPWWKLGDEFS